VTTPRKEIHMSVRITVDIFSGRPNPSVELKGREAANALERLAPARALSRREARMPESTLGYRGLVVELVGERTRKLPRAFRVADGVILTPDGAFEARDPRFEDDFCGTTGPKLGLKRDFSRVLLRELDRFRDIRERWPIKPKWPLRPACPCAPLYEPAWWNDADGRQYNNNCYNYASNYRSDTFAQPGRAAGAMYTALTCASVRPAAIADSLIDAPNANNKCPKEGHLVALVIWPGGDFHWYRRGRNGRWSHKPGGTQATNLDNSGHLITDPRTADRGPYTDFCTFMVVMHGHIKIQ
jgi:hypothetical protein